MNEQYFLKSIQALRLLEEIHLFDRGRTVLPEDSQQLIDFLRLEYARESVEYPYSPPDFDPAAACWAAGIVYLCAQLVISRENSIDEIAISLPKFGHPMTASAILSADLCLRFVPSILRQLQFLDSEDEIIPLLQSLLLEWHYSGINCSDINYILDIQQLNFDVIASNPTLHQLYIDRIITYSHLSIALHPACEPLIRATIGIFGHDFWKEFTIESTLYDTTIR